MKTFQTARTGGWEEGHVGVGARKPLKAPRRGLGLRPGLRKGAWGAESGGRGGPCASAILPSPGARPRSPRRAPRPAARRDRSHRSPPGPAAGMGVGKRSLKPGRARLRPEPRHTVRGLPRGSRPALAHRPRLGSPYPAAATRGPRSRETRSSPGQPFPSAVRARGAEGPRQPRRGAGGGLAAASRTRPGVPPTHAPLWASNTLLLARSLRTDREPEVTATRGSGPAQWHGGHVTGRGLVSQPTAGPFQGLKGTAAWILRKGRWSHCEVPQRLGLS